MSNIIDKSTSKIPDGAKGPPDHWAGTSHPQVSTWLPPAIDIVVEVVVPVVVVVVLVVVVVGS